MRPDPTGFRYRTAAGLLGVALAGLPDRASGATLPGVAYEEQRWTHRDGLPQSSVTGIAPAPDGSLWLATFGGLARFDGQRATTITPAADVLARVSRLASLLVNPDQPGELFVGSVDEGLWVYADGRFTQPPQPEPLARSTIYNMVQQDGHLLLTSNRGAYARARDGTWTQLSPTTSLHVSLNARGESLFCLYDGGYLLRHPDGTVTQRAFPTLEDSRGQHTMCFGSAPHPGGGWWLQTPRKLLHMTAQGDLLTVPGIELDSEWGQRPLIDQAGHLWVSDTTAALDLGRPEDVLATAEAGRPVTPRRHAVGQPRAWHADDSGTLWVGTIGSGLARLTPMGFARPDTQLTVGARGVGPLHGDDAALWFTTDCDEIHLREAGRPSREVPMEPSADGQRRCVRTLWVEDEAVTVVRGMDLLQGDASGLSIVDDLKRSGMASVVAVLRPRAAGGLWLGTEDGQLWVRDAAGIRRHEPPLPPDFDNALSVLETPEGLLIGHQRGLCRLAPGADDWTCLDQADGLVPGNIRHLTTDETGRVWMASYGGGLGWLDASGPGRIPIGSEGIADRFLSAVVFDPHGSVWLQGNAGLTRVLAADLERKRERPDLPLRTELVPLGEANGWLRQSAALLGDGSLWLAGVSAVTAVDTAAYGQPKRAAAPLLRGARLGDVTLDEDQETPVSPDVYRRLEVQYASPVRNPTLEPWFEHRLLRDGQETDWVEVAGARSAVFSDLAPGRYRFEVRSVALDGSRSPTAAVAFRVQPHWWERSWVLSFGLFGLVGLAAFAQGTRTRAVARRNAELRAEITLRKQAEQMLQDREDRFRQVFRQSVNGFLLHDERGRCVAANPTACRLFGTTQEEMLDSDWASLGIPTLEAEAARGPEPVLCTRVDGSTFPARVDRVRYDGRQGPRVLTSVVDLSALVDAQNQERRLRRQLASAQRLEALGRLAGGVAHDINNVLAAVHANVELLGEMADPNEPEATECLEDAREGVRRGSAMVRQLLAFSRHQAVESSDLDPARLAEGLARMLRQLLPADRTLHVETAPCGLVRMNRTQLEQVLLNLVLNAADVVGTGGAVHVRVGPGAAPQTALIEVEDNGPGIDEDVLEHIFEPFFTTKEAGSGTGLGLPTARGIVEEAGGTIEVETSAQGTCFRVTLPRVSSAPAPEPSAAPGPRDGGGRTLLLVDDDDGVRRSLRRQLVRAGWTVEDFSDPIQSLARLQHGEAPAALITDVIMPRMNGRQLAMAATRVHPTLPVLYISGYTADVLGGEIDGSERLLHKPFSPERLLDAVHALVDGTPEPARG